MPTLRYNWLASALLLLVSTPACNHTKAAPTDGVLYPDCPQPREQPQPGKAVRLMVPMRDCVRLATNVILPEGEGPFPVIVIRTPYGRSHSDFNPAPGIGDALFAAHGYAVVEQDVRGRFESEGEFIPYLVERKDTEDTLDWVALQPWYNGKLGVWGLSYLGLTAELAMVARPNLVDAAFIGEIRSDFYGAAFEHGLARADTLGLWLLGVLEKYELSFSSKEEQADAMLKFPLLDGDLRVTGKNIDFIDDFADHLYADEFWTSDINPEQLAQTKIPLLMLEGWFDLFAKGMLADWNNIWARRLGKDQFIVVGPWTHLMGFTEQDYGLPQAGSIANYLPDMLAFFDRYLKDAGEAAFSPPAARYYDGGLGQWKSDQALWPSKTTTWRLYADLAVTRPACAGQTRGLLAAAPVSAASHNYVYDPYNPVIFNAANILDTYGRDGIQIDNDWCERSDVVVFETDAITQSIELAGNITAHLYVASNAVNTSFVVRLSLIDSDGQAYNLRESAMLLSHRLGDSTQVSYTPGSTVYMAVPLTPLRWTLKPGQKLRLVVTSSGYPFVAPYPNTAVDNWLTAPQAVTAIQSVVTGSGEQPTGLAFVVAQ